MVQLSPFVPMLDTGTKQYIGLILLYSLEKLVEITC